MPTAVGSSGRTRTLIILINSQVPLHSASLEYYGGDLGQTSPEVPTLGAKFSTNRCPRSRADNSVHARGKPVRVRIGER